MYRSDLDDVFELVVLVDGEPQELDLVIPRGYDGRTILQLLMEDVAPAEPGADAGADGVDGGMSPEAFDAWETRAATLHAIDWNQDRLDAVGLAAGAKPGIVDPRTGAPSVQALDETLERDLDNVTTIINEWKAEFRARREMSGASRQALADALEVDLGTVEGWESLDGPDVPRDAWNLVECWQEDAMDGARWHVRQALRLRSDFNKAYVLTIYRSQEEFDRVLAPLLANAPHFSWDEALNGPDIDVESWTGDDYTDFPGTRSYWRAHAAARIAAALMETQSIPFGFAYAGEPWVDPDCQGVWVPCVDTQRIEIAAGTLIVVGMR